MPGYIKNKGSILIISLWILMIIALLCISLARQIRTDLRLTKFQKDKIKCLYIAKAAMQKVISVLENDPTAETDSLSDLWSIGYNPDAPDEQSCIFKDMAVGGGRFSVSYIFEEESDKGGICLYGISDEERKININKASKELLLAMFDVMAAADPESLAQNILYWRNRQPESRYEPYYENSKTPHTAAKLPFKAMEELILVKGFKENPELIEKCQRIFTVYTKNNSININTAPADVLKAVFISLGAEKIRAGLSDSLARNIIDYRDGGDNKDATADDTAINAEEVKEVLKSGLTDLVEIGWIDKQVFPFTTKSDLFRAEAAAELKNSRTHNKVTAIIDRGKKPCRIIYWYEQ